MRMSKVAYNEQWLWELHNRGRTEVWFSELPYPEHARKAKRASSPVLEILGTRILLHEGPKVARGDQYRPPK